MNTEFEYTDIMGKTLAVDDQILYAVADGILQVGRIREVLSDNQGIKVIGKGNRREGLIRFPDKQVFLHRRGYYKKHKKRTA